MRSELKNCFSGPFQWSLCLVPAFLALVIPWALGITTMKPGWLALTIRFVCLGIEAIVFCWELWKWKRRKNPRR